MIFSYKRDNLFQNRINECCKIKRKYPNRIPIICEKDPKCKLVSDLKKIKYLAPLDISIGQFMHVIRKQLRLRESQSIYFKIDNMIPPCTVLMQNLYDVYSDEDGYLYISYIGENTFG